ncbi:MAG: A/G-specific adenine glycosylase [Clostridiales bacterium]|nr:A/G-specific adenine glycosylase [Clostridiales bacterium]
MSGRAKGVETLNPADAALLTMLPGPFLDWFRAFARDLPWRRDKEPYHVWLSEIMLQQTRVEAVRGYYSRFIDALPDISSLADAPEEMVYKLWEGLGYYRRAANLHKAARMVVRDMGGVFPSTYEGILALPGVGAYTAGAVASICFGLPKPAVDGNVIRVLARILDSDASQSSAVFKRQVEAGLEAVMTGAMKPSAMKPGAAAAAAAAAAKPGAAGLAGDLAGDFSQSLMEIGAVLCLPRGVPKCGACPASGFCRSCRSGRAELLPVRDLKKARRVEELTVFVLWKAAKPIEGVNGESGDGGGSNESGGSREESLALRRRGGKGLLAGMWELPNAPGLLDPGEAMAQVSAWGVGPASLERSLDRVHVFSHVEWRMRGYVIRVGSGSPGQGGMGGGDITWATAEERLKAYPLPTAFSLFLT